MAATSVIACQSNIIGFTTMDSTALINRLIQKLSTTTTNHLVIQFQNSANIDPNDDMFNFLSFDAISNFWDVSKSESNLTTQKIINLQNDVARVINFNKLQEKLQNITSQ